ncbi:MULTISPECIES: Abi family protein [Enterobacterales]|uniref:Abi family protein n=1 Tax=Edwardsiella tarda TaxID=636 RepID=UPI0034DD79BE|nr:Abi family protein [Escherichia coli]HDD9215217.1 Abi family protein [Escherichia coli]
MDNIVKLISPKRLNVYKTYFNATTEEQCLGLYIWNQKLSNVFNSIIHIIEVSLRNSIMNTINEKKPTLSGEGFISYFRSLDENNESRKQIEYAYSKCHKKSNYTTDDLIALLPFGFWANICSQEHNESNEGSLQLWPTYKDDIFPDTDLSIGEIYKNISVVNILRNRISHHEVIWKDKNALNQDGLINKVIDNYKSCLEVAKSIHIDNLKLIELIEGKVLLENLCKTSTIDNYTKLISDITKISVIDIPEFVKTNRKETIFKGEVTSVNSNATYIKNNNLRDSDNKKIKFRMDNEIRIKIGPLKVGDIVTFEPFVIRNDNGKFYIAKKVTLLQ